MIHWFREAEVVTIPVVQRDQMHCSALVKEAKDAYRACRKPPEFWIKVSWSDAEVMVCFTHYNAYEVHLRL